jgi:N6-adenosine-specific RNA methylase IME4
MNRKRTPPPPPRAGNYQVIYADPPWAFETYSVRGKGRGPEAHYDCMTLSEIASLPVSNWAAATSVLYLWCTVPHLESALKVLATWGFSYKSNFVWVKEKIGTGYWCRNRHELLLIGSRGTRICPRFRGISPVDSIIQGQQRAHSQKPDGARQVIERYHPNANRLEMFAREKIRGWDSWGLEVATGIGRRRWKSNEAPNELPVGQ